MFLLVDLGDGTPSANFYHQSVVRFSGAHTSYSSIERFERGRRGGEIPSECRCQRTLDLYGVLNSSPV